MKETKDSKKKQNDEKDMDEKQPLTFIEGLDIDADMQALDIAGEAYQSY